MAGPNETTSKVTLQGDPSSLVNAYRIAEEQSKKFRDSVLSSTTAFEGLGGAITKVSGLFAGLAAGAGLSKMIGDAASWNLEAAKMARTMGITTEQSSVMAVALHGLGISNDVAESAALKLSRTLSQGTDKFDKFGITVKDSSGNLLPMTQIMANVNQKLLETQTGADRNIMAMTLYGRSWGELQQILRLTPEALNEARETAERLHLVVGAEGVAKSLAYKKGLNEIELIGHSLSVQLGTELMPIVVDLGLAFGESGVKAAGFFGGILHGAITNLEETKIRVTGFMEKMGAILADGPGHTGPLFNWLSKAGRQEIKEQMDAIDSMTNYSLAKLDERSGAIVKPRPRTSTATGRLDPNLLGTGTVDIADELYKKYSNSFDEIYKRLHDIDPNLSKFDREMLSVYETVQKLSDEMPQYNKSWFEWGSRMETTIKAQEKFKLENKALTDSIKELEKANEGLIDSFLASDKLYQKSFLEYQPMKGTQYSLSGLEKKQPSGLSLMSTTGYKNPEIDYAESDKAKLLAIEERYNQQILASKYTAGEQSLEIMRSVFQRGSALSIAALAAQKVLSISQILMQSEVAAMGALTLPPLGLGPILGQGLAEEIRAMGYVSAGLVAAAGAVQIGQQLGGARADGGPVIAGKTYIVNENRATQGPEYFTPGVSGTITPANKMGGATYAPVYHIDARNSTLNEAQIQNIVERANQRSKTDILNDMQRGGNFALAASNAARRM